MSDGMWSAGFWIESADRAVKSAAQAALLVIGADQLDMFATNWGDVASFALGGAALSVLTSLVSAPFGRAKGTPQVL